ncbi:MAG: amino acid ABC transporter ATP-binding protein [Lachnospiraceae bacterium]|nr:amino acid ABC transporter ATP-binding protein [Lachnospiraceae bacterium]
MIRVRNLSKKFRQNVVLDDINLDINQGDVIAVIGPSGTGKSTLLRCIERLEVPESGTVEIEDRVIGLAPGKARRKDLSLLHRSCGMVFQNWNLFYKKTALENVMEGMVTVKKIPKAKAREIALSYLDKVGLSDRAGHYPRHLSGGQQQRVAIARAMAMEPGLLLFDEPTSALDPELVGEVLDTIRQAADAGYTMILVSHEMNFVRKVANRVIFLENGHIIEDGTPKEIFSNPKSERLRQFIMKIDRLQEPDYVI